MVMASLAYPVRDWTSCPRNPRDLLDSLNQEQRTITNQTDLQNETEREGAEVLAGRHMPSRAELQGRREQLQTGRSGSR